MSDRETAGATAAPPILRTSLTSAVILHPGGDVRFAREMRGTEIDWGGVFAQLVRLTGPWHISAAVDGRSWPLDGGSPADPPLVGGWRTEHAWGPLAATQEVAPLGLPAGAVRRLRLVSHAAEALSVRLRTECVPYLLPVLVEGIRPTRFRVELGPDASVVVRSHLFSLRLRVDPPPGTFGIDDRPLGREAYEGAVESVTADSTLEVPAGGTATATWTVTGGIDRDRRAAEASGGAALPPDPREAAGSVARADAAWTARTPELEVPDAPELEAAYRSARAALRRLYTAPADDMVGLVAGYPWYSAIWCRDLAVMLPAVLWLGDAEWVERSLRTVFRFQSRRAVEILGGEPGELPKQHAPGPIFLYGTSDTTLRFPAVVERLHRHAGNTGYLNEWADAIARIVEWGRRRTDPATGLLRHGGEAEAISAATAPLSRVRYGIDAVDTTIWDSTDRRDHAIDVQVLWWETLEMTGRLLAESGGFERGTQYREEAARLARSAVPRYALPGGEYLADTIRGGAPVPRLRPNALRAVSAGWLDPGFAARVVRRAAAPDLMTPWGMRTLSANDPGYRPDAYHDGQVWPIATAWAADAAFAAGAPAEAYGHLAKLVADYRTEGGAANECYRGDRPEPYDSCFLLGLSVAPFLRLLFERVWGLAPDALGMRLGIRPEFPPSWSAARLSGLRIGPGTVDIAWHPGRIRVRWSGPGPLRVAAGTGAPVDLAPASARELPLGRPV